MVCTVCGGRLAFFGRRLQYQYFSCQSCRTIQLHPQPTREQLAAAYQNYSRAGHYEREPAASRQINRNSYLTIADALSAHKVSGPILDYKAGWGGLVEMLRSEGHDCRGVDLDPDMAAWCQSHGLPVECGDFDAVAGQQFAALTLCVVFEHLVDHDRWLQAANRALQPGGLLITLNPTAQFARTMGTLLRLGIRRLQLPQMVELFSPPWHIMLISIEGAILLFSRNGFELEEIRWTRSSRHRGVVGGVQMLLEAINRVGWRLLGTRWPLQVCHTLVFRKTQHVSGSEAAAEEKTKQRR